MHCVCVVNDEFVFERDETTCPPDIMNVLPSIFILHCMDLLRNIKVRLLGIIDHI